MGYIYILLTILFTVYGQLIIKWRMGMKGQMPETDNFLDKIWFLMNAFLDIWIISGLAAAFLASFCWAAVLTKFELSYAYPFTALSLVLVFLSGIFVFGEGINLYKIIGMFLIVAGILVLSIKN